MGWVLEMGAAEEGLVRRPAVGPSQGPAVQLLGSPPGLSHSGSLELGLAGPCLPLGAGVVPPSRRLQPAPRIRAGLGDGGGQLLCPPKQGPTPALPPITPGGPNLPPPLAHLAVKFRQGESPYPPTLPFPRPLCPLTLTLTLTLTHPLTLTPPTSPQSMGRSAAAPPHSSSLGVQRGVGWGRCWPWARNSQRCG